MNMQSAQTCVTTHKRNSVTDIAVHEQDVAFLNDHGKRILSGDTELELEPAKRASVSLLQRANGTYCEDCNIQFSRSYTFRRHREDSHGSSSTFLCDEDGCSKSFTRRDTLARHKVTQHGDGKVTCAECGSLVRKDGLRDHMSTRICRNSRAAVHHMELGSRDSVNSRDEMQVPDKWLAQGQNHVEDKRQSGFSTHEPNVTQVSYATSESNSVQTGVDVTNEHRLFHRSIQIDVDSSVRGTLLESLQTPNSTVASAGISSLEIVPDSPRPVPSFDSLCKLFLDDGTNAEDLALEFRTLRGGFQPRGPSSQGLQSNATSLRSEFLVPVNRFYNMSLGSNCALCAKGLGHDVGTVFQHAQSHLLHFGRSKLQCSVCKITFAFENDLKLHSSELEMWSFCREMPPVEAQDQVDWVAIEYTKARQDFIDVLRLWETLQLHWYLAAVRTLLKTEVAYRSRRFLSIDPTRKPISKNSYRRFMSLSKNRASVGDNTTIESLNEMFSATSLSAPHCRPEIIDTRPRWHIDRPTHFRVIGPESMYKAGARLPALRYASMQQAQASLRAACWEGDLAEVNMHLMIGTDIQATDQMGFNPLMYAIVNRHAEVARVLVERGACVHHTCVYGRTALHYACGRYLTEIVNLLIRKGTQLEATDIGGETPLVWTARIANMGSEILLEDGGSFDPYSKFRLRRCDLVDGKKATLELCTRHALYNIVHLLLDYAADVNAIGTFGKTALIHAVRAGNKEVVKALLERGADMDIEDKVGRNALSYANEAGCDGILKLLRRTRRARFVPGSIRE